MSEDGGGDEIQFAADGLRVWDLLLPVPNTAAAVAGAVPAAAGAVPKVSTAVAGAVAGGFSSRTRLRSPVRKRPRPPPRPPPTTNPYLIVPAHPLTQYPVQLAAADPLLFCAIPKSSARAAVAGRAASAVAETASAAVAGTSFDGFTHRRGRGTRRQPCPLELFIAAGTFPFDPHRLPWNAVFVCTGDTLRGRPPVGEPQARFPRGGVVAIRRARRAHGGSSGLRGGGGDTCG